MGSQNVIDYRKRRKQNLMAICGGKCCICGYDKTPVALEFHHLIPEEKSYGLGASGLCHKIEDDIAEIRKCVLVCANCHREIHDNFYELSELQQYQNFNEEIIKSLTTYKKDVKLYCKECGCEITSESSTGLCSICAAKNRRKVERPTSNDLFNKLKELKGNFTQVGTFYGVSDNAVRKWCKAYQIPHKSSDYKNME